MELYAAVLVMIIASLAALAVILIWPTTTVFDEPERSLVLGEAGALWDALHLLPQQQWIHIHVPNGLEENMKLWTIKVEPTASRPVQCVITYPANQTDDIAPGFVLRFTLYVVRHGSLYMYFGGYSMPCGGVKQGVIPTVSLVNRMVHEPDELGLVLVSRHDAQARRLLRYIDWAMGLD